MGRDGWNEAPSRPRKARQDGEHAMARHSDNPQQLAAISEIHGAIAVNAGAGSGKTHVITERVARLIEGGHATADRILVLTFTVKAAHEFSSRIERRMGKPLMWSSNFHRLCGRLIRDFGMAPNGHFSIMNAEASHALAEEVASLSADMTPDRRKSIAPSILAAVEAKRYAAYAGDTPPSYGEELDALSDAYEAALKRRSAYDFDGLIFAVATRLGHDREMGKRVSGLWDFILVDELQDTSPIQFELLKLLAPHGNIMGVGDMDQGVYAFRGAVPANMTSFVDHFRAKVLPLELNYRSKREILAIANAVIDQNDERIRKTLMDTRSSGGIVDMRIHDDAAAEAEFIADAIKAYVNGGGDPKSIAVLARTHAACAPLELALTSRGMRHRPLGGAGSEWDRGIALSLVAIAKVMVGSGDCQSWLVAMANPSVGVSEREFDCGPTAIPVEDQVERMSAINPKMREFLMALRASRRMVRSGTGCGEALGRMVTLSGFRDHVLATARTSEDRMDRARRIDAVLRIAGSYESMTRFANDMTFGSPDDPFADDDAVAVGTIHGAKGLEWGIVHIIGCHDDAMPHRAGHSDPSAMREERRLLHVAMTRAMDELHIHCPERVVPQFGNGTMEPVKASRFLVRAMESLPIAIYRGRSGLAVRGSDVLR
jgi:DNA helicase-2/ATP-dependent DNA helicase PcrA